MEKKQEEYKADDRFRNDLEPNRQQGEPSAPLSSTADNASVQDQPATQNRPMPPAEGDAVNDSQHKSGE